MVLTSVIASLCLLSLGGLVVGAGLIRLDRLDRRRMESARQNACRWHHWEVLEQGTWLVCALCGKKSRKVNPAPDRGPDTIPSENLFP